MQIHCLLLGVLSLDIQKFELRIFMGSVIVWYIVSMGQKQNYIKFYIKYVSDY